MPHYTVTDIRWDLDDNDTAEQLGLPSESVVELSEADAIDAFDEALADALSRRYGVCVESLCAAQIMDPVLKLEEVLYDGDSYFFVTAPGQRPRLSQVRCWTEYSVDTSENSVSDIAGEIIRDTLCSLGYAVAFARYDATNAVDRRLAAPEDAGNADDDLPTVFSAQQEACGEYLRELMSTQEPGALFVTLSAPLLYAPQR